jgi:hypothetical protein
MGTYPDQENPNLSIKHQIIAW